MSRFLIAFLLAATPCAFVQDAPVWELLPTSPFNSYRNEDVFFVDAEYGWAVDGDGEVNRTTDGGETWAFMGRRMALSVLA